MLVYHSVQLFIFLFGLFISGVFIHCYDNGGEGQPKVFLLFFLLFFHATVRQRPIDLSGIFPTRDLFAVFSPIFVVCDPSFYSNPDYLNLLLVDTVVTFSMPIVVDRLFSWGKKSTSHVDILANSCRFVFQWTQWISPFCPCNTSLCESRKSRQVLWT